jgi:hypothetical protein
MKMVCGHEVHHSCCDGSGCRGDAEHCHVEQTVQPIIAGIGAAENSGV